MSMMEVFNGYQRVNKVVNLGLNFFGYFPETSVDSGKIRIYYGIIKATAIAGFFFMGAEALSYSLASQLFHSGVYHILRGCVEQMTGWGNVACLVHDTVKLFFNNFDIVSIIWDNHSIITDVITTVSNVLDALAKLRALGA